MASILPFDEINAMMQESANALEGIPDKEKARILADEMLDILIFAYAQGVSRTREDLGVPLEDEIDEMYEIIFCRLDGKTFEDRILTHVENGDNGRIGTLAESEAHRVCETAGFDSAVRASDEYGITVGKRWDTMLDDRVRSTHSYLEGRVVPLDEEFWTYDGDHAQYPGGFMDSSNNVNCRCALSYTNITGTVPDIGQGSP